MIKIGKLAKWKRLLAAARFELAPPKRLVPKTSALDRSATLPHVKIRSVNKAVLWSSSGGLALFYSMLSPLGACSYYIFYNVKQFAEKRFLSLTEVSPRDFGKTITQLQKPFEIQGNLSEYEILNRRELGSPGILRDSNNRGNHIPTYYHIQRRLLNWCTYLKRRRKKIGKTVKM